MGFHACLLHLQDYMDHGGHPDRSKDSANMRKYVDSMLQDLRKAHKVREEQLSSAAQNYKARLDAAARKHEELLVAYRYCTAWNSLRCNLLRIVSNHTGSFDNKLKREAWMTLTLDLMS